LIELALDDVEPWLDDRMSSALKPLLREWEGLRKDVEKAIREARDACERIREEGEKCLSDKDHRKHKPGKAALRFYRMISGVLEAVKTPSELSVRAITDCQRSLARVYNAIGREWSGLLAQMEPYMIRARRKLKGVWRKIGGLVRDMDALVAKCQPLELRDEVSSSLSRIRKLLSELEAIRGEIGMTSLKEEEVKKELEELLKAKEALEKSEAISRLKAVEERLEALRIEVRTELRHAWKPFIKLRSSASSGAVSLSPDELGALEAYLSDPASALAEDGEGYPSLRSLLLKLEDALERGLITLKASKAEKLRRWLDEALEGSLSSLQNECRKAIRDLEEMRNSGEVQEALRKLRGLEDRISELEKKAEMLRSKANSLRSREKGLVKKIGAEVASLEGLLTEITGEEVRVIVRL